MIKLYTIGCPKCSILEKKLDAANVNYEKVTDKDIMIEKGFDVLPILEIDGTIYNFEEACDWLGVIR